MSAADQHPTRPIRRSLTGKPPPKRPPKAAASAPPRPDLPTERVDLPSAVFRDIKRTVKPGVLEDVANAVGAASLAVEEGDLDRAMELLEWAKSKAPRSAAIREGLGIAHYLAHDFDGAQRELQAYRRLSGRVDQNHLLADAARALGRLDRVAELVDEMVTALQERKAPLDRTVEAVIVHAGALADQERYEEALALLDRSPLPDGGATVSHARAWYAAGDIAERMGDRGLAAEYFHAASMVEDDFLDAEARVDALDS